MYLPAKLSPETICELRLEAVSRQRKARLTMEVVRAEVLVEGIEPDLQQSVYVFRRSFCCPDTLVSLVRV